MRIIYIIDKPNLYGSELHLLDLIKYFKNENDIMIIAFSEGILLKRFKELSIEYKVICLSWFPNIKKLLIFRKIIKNIAPHVIHSHQPKAVFYSSLIARTLRIPSIITIHSDPLAHAMVYRGLMYHIVYIFHCIIQFISELLADKTIFVSETSRKNAYFKKKSLVIYNCVSERFKIINKQKILNKNGKINILCVGSLTYGKGYDILMEFLEKIKFINFKINIIGDGLTSYIEYLKKLAKEKGIIDKLKFCGYKNNLSYYYERSDVFTLFSRSETFGLSYIEAMYHGLPIFALDLKVLKEIIPPCNFISNDLNKLSNNFLNLIDNPDFYHKVYKQNIEFARKHFNYNKNMENVKKIYCDYC